jgi:hypothetical protein
MRLKLRSQSEACHCCTYRINDLVSLPLSGNGVLFMKVEVPYEIHAD